MRLRCMSVWAWMAVLTWHTGFAVAETGESRHDLAAGADLFSRVWEAHLSSVPDRTGAAPQVDSPQQVAKARRRRLLNGAVDLNVAPGEALVGKRGDGLGPLHNATSCADCHPAGGGSGVEHNVILLTIEPRSEALTEPLAEYGQQLRELFPTLLDADGNLRIELVVHDHSTLDGYTAVRERLANAVPGGIEESWFNPAQRTSAAVAGHPVIAGRLDDVDFYLSQRNTPALYGVGLIDQIQSSRLLLLAAKQEHETQGEVTGRVAGKFGWRGQIDSLANFVSLACANELGLTQRIALQPIDPGHPEHQPPGIDVTQKEVDELTQFVAHLPMPVEGTANGYPFTETDAGESLFNQVGCAICHVPDNYPVTDIFSDLLLHDMGPDLQAPSPAGMATSRGRLTRLETLRLARRDDIFQLPTYPVTGPASATSAPAYYGPSGLEMPAPLAIDRPDAPQFPRGPLPRDIEDAAGTWDAQQREWRTPPLWGVASTAPYLHDGRAATLKEAIMWHGGEALSSRKRFAKLETDEQNRLLAFLQTLQAPAPAHQ